MKNQKYYNYIDCKLTVKGMWRDRNEYGKRTWAEISLNAIEHNYNIIRNKVADDTKVCCVIKADGYGHGAVELSQIYEKLGADFLLFQILTRV